MPLGEYPFSKQFGWLVDKFGVSWQLNLGRRTQSITPSLMFVGANYGKAEEAMNFYVSQFKNSRIINLERYVPGEPEPVGTVKHATFSLNGEEFMAMDSNGVHPFTFTPAISFFTNCATQEEVDELWDNLSQDGEKSRCGWLADKYGISWQIVPSVLGQILQENNHEKSERVMKALFQMEKLDVKGLVQAAGALHS